MAWGSDLCVVGNLINDNVEYVDSVDIYKYTTATDALAFKYCFDYAEQQGKPCVVSFSEGYAPYLDDEDSLFSTTLEQMTGPGRIIVAAAGNEGVEKTYFEKTEDQPEAGSFIRCFKENALYRIKTEGEMRLVVYGYHQEESGKWKVERGMWNVESGMWNVERGMPSDTIAFETAEVPIDTIIRREMILGQDTLHVMAYRDYSRFADHDIWQLYIESDRSLGQLSPLAVVVQGEKKIEVYGSSTYAFRDDEADSRWSASMVGRNVFAPGCFPGIICVGATSHRPRIQNLEGQEVSKRDAGKIGSYSSTGPTMNDLMKPDVVAPGTNVISSFNHISCPEERVLGYSDYDGERYPWGVDSGTSMAAPVVAGGIALWLQAKPDLTPQEIMEVMARTSRHPEAKYDYPNNIYGYGEIDAYRGLLEVLSLTGIEGISLHQPSGIQVFPVEGGLRLVFDRVVTAPVCVRVYNLSGVCIHTCQLTAVTSEAFVALPAVLSGICAVQVETPDRSLQGSVLVRF
jgi:subtilisin family serine protease